jgi:hypothetical protein
MHQQLLEGWCSLLTIGALEVAIFDDTDRRIGRPDNVVRIADGNRKVDS